VTAELNARTRPVETIGTSRPGRRVAGYPVSAFDLTRGGPWHPQPAKRTLEQLGKARP
jgi:hypothetical protein